ncbi:hypothetical protein ACPA9J_23505 [Pseudomonas aeruginosa]
MPSSWSWRSAPTWTSRPRFASPRDPAEGPGSHPRIRSESLLAWGRERHALRCSEAADRRSVLAT